MFAPFAKGVAEIDRTDRIPEYISHAVHVAQSGRPGPVVLALPEDMLSAQADVADVTQPAKPAEQTVAPYAIQNVLGDLAAAKNPMMIVGGPKWSAECAALLADFAKATGLPVGTSFRSQDYIIDNRHPNFIGDVGIGPHPDLAKRIDGSDVLLVLGARLGEITTGGYAMLTPPQTKQRLIHVHANADEIGRVYVADRGVCCDPKAFLQTALDLVQEPLASPPTTEHASYEAWQTPFATPGDVKMEQVITHLSAVMPEDAIVTNGAGNYAAWLHRYYRYKSYRTQLAPTSGSMGYGLPAAVAAKLERLSKRLCVWRVMVFSNVHAGIRHGRAVWRQYYCDRLKQWRLRNNPHASTTPLSQSSIGYGYDQS